MNSGGGKRKGAGFEREICQKLSLWISEGKRKDVFWRSAMSGGRATIQFKKGEQNKSQTGDISCIDQIGQKLTDRFVIECKFYSNIHLESLIYGKPKSSSILEFWLKVSMQAADSNKHPLIIFKENGKEILIGGDDYLHNKFLDGSALVELGYFYEYSLCLYSFDQFLDEIDPAILELL